ncbi:Kinase, NEK [Spironucleus salmonicida]|uniref:non-specific serine/threonine protein kinase n=1 Tax=Spironucleus salmonicida TaxID=348837 RepID=V6LVY6_9EUKA|nr:Kinase, NEK [Spironucleus salmonicida]|eukprot:EST48725.1 Kinase, NEK [Spironucleus salmonicida]
MSVHADYQTMNLLGQGSFGKVYKVQSRRDGKIYAMKEINYSKMKTKEKELLVSEVNLLRKLDHQSIVKYVDRYQDKNLSTIYIVMELCQAGDLSKFIKTRKTQQKYIEEELVWTIFLQVLQAVDYCHHPPPTSQLTQKLINRDLKPANVFLTDQRTIKVGDFGLCRTLGDQSIAKTNVGTPLYMAPELLENKPYNEKVDIWSLGCILYEMCALQPPYVATSMDSLKLKVARGIRPFIPAHYSKELKETIDAMLHKDFNRRVGTKDVLAMPWIQKMVNAMVPKPQVNQVEQVPQKTVTAPFKPAWQKPSYNYVFGFDGMSKNNAVLWEQQLKLKESELEKFEKVIDEKEKYAKERCAQLGIGYDWI